MRSVILEYLLQGVKSQRLNEKDYFGESKKGDELMRFIKFSDTEFEETALVNTKIFNLRKSDNDWVGGWKHSSKNTDKKFQLTGFNTLYEAILPDEKSICSIMISDIDIFKLIEREATNELKYKIEEDKKKSKEEDLKKDTRILKIKENILSKKEKLFSINELFKIINEHTKKYINKEIVFFENYKTDKTEEIVNNLKQIKAQIFADSSVCIMKMSAGSGFHSITGDWQYDDYTNTGTWAEKDRNKTHHANAPKYKSRKIAIHNDIFSMMGFVKLRIMSDEEFYDYQVKHEQVKQQIVAEKQAEREKIKQEQERYILEQEQKTQEEVEKQRQIKEEQLKKEQAKKAEQERLDNMSPDDREKEKYKNGIQAEIGNLVNASINNGDLTSDFYKWLKHYLDKKKLWSVNINDKKNKWIKRCIAIEEKLK
jgi:hypothetical protein